MNESTIIIVHLKLPCYDFLSLTNPGPRVALDVSSTEQQQPQPITTAASLRGRRDLLLKMVCKRTSLEALPIGSVPFGPTCPWQTASSGRPETGGTRPSAYSPPRKAWSGGLPRRWRAESGRAPRRSSAYLGLAGHCRGGSARSTGTLEGACDSQPLHSRGSLFRTSVR